MNRYSCYYLVSSYVFWYRSLWQFHFAHGVWG
jgi:hypothetical protein